MQSSRVPSRASSPWILGCAEYSQSGMPSDPRPRGHRAVSRREELDSQPDGLDHGLNPIKSSNLSY